MSDIVAPGSHPSRMARQMVSQKHAEAIRHEDIVLRAKSLINTALTPSPTAVKALYAKSETIHSMVQSIQHTQATTTVPASYGNSTRSLQDPADEPTISLWNRFRSVFIFHSRRSMLSSAMAVLLVVGGVVALLSSVHSNSLVTLQVQALSDKADKASDESTGQSTDGLPSEDKIPDAVISSYSVAPDVPRYISIPKIKISKTRILRMGLDSEGAIKTPRNVWDSGWYEGSSNPSEKVGSALIMGHVSGPTNGGIFYNLYRLTDGDDINVTQGDGTVYTYKVVAKEEVPADGLNMNNYLISKNVDKPGLTLMTCAGEFNPKTQTYDKRLAVFAIRTN